MSTTTKSELTVTEPLLIPLAKEYLAMEHHVSARVEEKCEKEIMRLINKAISAQGYTRIRDWFFEPGCREHGVVHIFFAEGQAILTIEPSTGVVFST